ncbi:NAD(P)H-dependent oxidoreductase [Cohnella faecalis]|uniref:Flavodoxin family protein n=1 Tax=Cohnella faecalis TaxID=2315694 RepID=A0A398CZA8_9BACL|nr:NAD(P)H-dependent oxidoreductase [Cohnella faecalis]RIE05187.1 flavodoxin family protein [Cohnella faecalis]
MKNILILNGHQKYNSTDGKLNRTLVEEMLASLRPVHNVQLTVLQDGYRIEDERQRFLRSDVVIFQTPIYWFNVPGLLKTFMDEVYEYGTFFKGTDSYGTGGLLTDKEYMFSATWNAPEHAFNDPSQFFQGGGLEDALAHLHRTQRYIGMKPLKSYACYDVIKNPSIDKFVSGLRAHLREIGLV